MPKSRRASSVLLPALLLMLACTEGPSNALAEKERIVIAHRGASGYLPEHTIAAKALAHAQGADFIEQDLVMTRDDELVVLHDLYLDSVSNVAELYPGRARDDGRHYVVDFTLAELRQLDVMERFRDEGGVATPVFSGRFPLGKATFRVHTFAEEIELIQGLNESTGRSVGLYPEIKNPAFHRSEGKDIAVAALQVLSSYGYVKANDKVYLQCFDRHELMRIHEELLPDMKMGLGLVQLMDTKPEYAELLTEEGIQRVSGYAVGIGPSMHLLINPASTADDLRMTGLVELAHAAGLEVHPFTFRREPDQIPAYATDFDNLLDIFFNRAGVDGIFTDFPDLAVRFIEEDRRMAPTAD